VSDEELDKRTSWARSVILDKWRTLDPFTDQIQLGARAALPRTFEKATAVAKRFSVASLNEVEFKNALLLARERLTEIYRSQQTARDVSPADEANTVITAISRPLRLRSARQGFNLTAAERRLIELRAMEVTQEWLSQAGYNWKDHSSSASFDLLAEKDGIATKVEVKGTTSDICDAIIMTKNEVNLHREEKGSTSLAIVSSIRLHREPGAARATGGSMEMLWQWDIDEWTSEAIAFQVKRAN